MPDPRGRGWFPDPDGSPRLRLWDGSRWTPHYAPPPGPLDKLLAAGEHQTEQGRKRFRRGWLIAGIVVVVVFGAGFGACALVMSQLPELDLFGPPLTPIPVPRSSCSYLRGVHDTAETAGRAWREVGGVAPVGAHLDDPKVWPLYAALLRGRFTAFDLAMRTAVPHVPTQIAAKLQKVRDQVKIGLDQLPKATTANDYTLRTLSAVVSGYASLTQASELTGHACGFTLAPDPSVAGWPGAGPLFGQTATT